MSDRVIMTTTKRYKDQIGTEPGLSDREWRGPATDKPMIEISGCQRVTFKDLEMHVDRGTDAGPRCKAAFHVTNSASQISHKIAFDNIYVYGTGQGPIQGFESAFSVYGPNNADHNLWEKCHALCCKYGWLLEGANTFGNVIRESHVNYADVGIGAKQTIGSFQIENITCGWVKTLLLMPNATRASKVDGVDAEMCGLIFDVKREAGMRSCLTVANVSWNVPQLRWDKDPERFLIGKFGAWGGLRVSNLDTSEGCFMEEDGFTPVRNPDGSIKWKCVIAAQEPKNVVLDGWVEANVVQL